MATTEQKTKTIRYFVNGAIQTTDDRKLTPREILTNAGFLPAEDYRLIRDDGNKVLADLDKEESIHQDERFTALFGGPTPVS
jgi:hypothetical protein